MFVRQDNSRNKKVEAERRLHFPMDGLADTNFSAF
jgi:hypothetical protein